MAILSSHHVVNYILFLSLYCRSPHFKVDRLHLYTDIISGLCCSRPSLGICHPRSPGSQVQPPHHDILILYTRHTFCLTSWMFTFHSECEGFQLHARNIMYLHSSSASRKFSIFNSRNCVLFFSIVNILFHISCRILNVNKILILHSREYSGFSIWIRQLCDMKGVHLSNQLSASQHVGDHQL